MCVCVYIGSRKQSRLERWGERRGVTEEAVEMVGGADVGAVGTKPERREKRTERNPC